MGQNCIETRCLKKNVDNLITCAETQEAAQIILFSLLNSYGIVPVVFCMCNQSSLVFAISLISKVVFLCADVITEPRRIEPWTHLN